MGKHRKSAWRDYPPLCESYGPYGWKSPYPEYEKSHKESYMYTIFVQYKHVSGYRCLGTRLQASSKDDANRKFVEHLSNVEYAMVFPTQYGLKFTPPSSSTWKSEAL